ncbi:multidrug effflux MFS transporter [Anaplasmataceae bacterium AB001_6]|nr:multidrug effflux MFS transporter [Anaplasmataceae bacterium AB001_6]
MRINIFLSIFCIIMADISTDIISPAFPAMRNYFATTDGKIFHSLSINLLGFAISAPIYGYIADIYGRKKAVVLGMSIFTVATVLCSSAASINSFIFYRFLQGIGQGAAEIIGFAIIRDYYKGVESAKMFSLINMCIALSPALAPFVGGWIASIYNWQFIFYILFWIALIVVFLFILFFTETLKKAGSSQSENYQFYFLDSMRSYRQIMQNKSFVFYMMILILHFSWLWNAIASIPFIFIDNYGVSSMYMGFLALMYACFYMLGGFMNQQLLNFFNRRDILSFALYIPTFNCIYVIIMLRFFSPPPWAIELIMFLEPISLAIIISNLMSIALDCVEDNVTARATAIIVFMKLSAGSIVIFLVPFILKVTLPNMLIVTFFSSSVALMIFLFKKKKYHLS